MNITSFDDIINVWANDADKLALFAFLFFLPFNLILIISFFTESNNKKERISSIQIIYTIIFLSSLIAIIGIGQVILADYLDSLIRSAGIIFFVSGFILMYVINRLTSDIRDFKRNKSGLFIYNMVRFPEYSCLILITAGMSLSSLSPVSFFFTFLILVPLIILNIKKTEKKSAANDSSYIDYLNDTPMIIPSFKKIILKQKK